MTPAPFKVDSEQDAGVFVIRVEGELDMNTAPQLELALDVPLETPGSALVMDLSRCEFIDSTGIALIVRAWRQLGDDERFAICGIGAQVERVLDITGLEARIPTHPSREDAISRLRS